MRKFYPLLLLLSFFTVADSYAQFTCGADEIRAKLSAADPNYKHSLDQMDENIRSYIASHPPSGSSFVNGTLATLYYIPTVVHVIYDTDPTVGSNYNPSDANINAAINYINQVYNGTWAGAGGAILGAGDIQVQFVLATKDPSNAATTGINRISGSGVAGYSAFGMKLQGASGADELTVKNLSRWDPEKYYNIWTVNKIDGCDGYAGCGSFVAGYAYFPMSPGSTDANTFKLDGTLMLASQFNSGQKTLPHELGHMMNLYHPFQGNDPGNTGANTCPTNAVPATDGDKCADTDPVINPAAAPSVSLFACRTGNNSCTGTNYTDNTEKNFMNYTNCYQLFTNDQKTRMLASLATTQRASLASSWANNQGLYPATFAAPIAATSTPTSLLTAPANVAGISSVTLNGRSVYSLNATQDNGYLNNSTKWYDVFQLSPNTTYTMTVVLRGANNEQLGVWIDYDNNGSFNALTEQLYLNTNIPAATALAGITINFTTPVTWVGANNYVRLRLTEDLSTVFGVAPITNTSASLTYGQTEDYAAFLTGGLVSVSMGSFTGKQQADAINLKWNTAQELNMQSFDVERSYKAGAFEAIGNVLATGAANGAEYAFRDVNVAAAGDYLYRLKIKEQNGSFTYSNILKFTVREQKTLVVIGNPFRDKLDLLLPSANGTASFRITDAAGRTVYSNTMKLSGKDVVSLNLQNTQMSNGLYFLDVIVNGKRFTEKIIKQ